MTVTRRQFLVGTAVAGLGVVLPAPIWRITPPDAESLFVPSQTIVAESRIMLRMMTFGQTREPNAEVRLIRHGGGVLYAARIPDGQQHVVHFPMPIVVDDWTDFYLEGDPAFGTIAYEQDGETGLFQWQDRPRLTVLFQWQDRPLGMP
jgi:hypothetical protein